MRWAVVAALAVLLALPAVLGSYAVTIFILIFFYGFLGQAWNIVGGYAGQLSAGHAAFVGVGGYTAAMLSIEAGLTPWVGMFVGAALAALLGAIIGYLGFRFGLRGFYFVLLTVAFAEICRIAVSNIDAIGGPLGLYITFTGDPRQFQFRDGRVYYYIALALMLAATATAWAIERRRFGIYLAAIREDEAAAESLGVNALKYKMLAMVVSSFLTGLGGTFYAFYLFSLQPNTLFGIPLSVEIIIRPIVGGAGTLLGPILGSFILTPLAELSRLYLGQGGLHGAHLIAYGVLLIGVVLFLPEGAYPRLRRVLQRRSRVAPVSGPPTRRVVRRSGAGSRLSQATLGPSRAHGPRYKCPCWWYAGCPSASAAFRPSPGSTWRSNMARCSGSSARTAPARRRSSISSRAFSHRTRATSASATARSSGSRRTRSAASGWRGRFSSSGPSRA